MAAVRLPPVGGRRAGILLALLAIGLLGVGFGLRDPWPADEPRFALIGQDMAESGRWALPHRGPELYAEKPPVFLWAQAAAYLLTGHTRSAFLLPSLLAGLGVLALVFDLLRRMHGRRVAWWGTAALLFTLQFTLQARTAQIDMLLTLFTTLGLYGLIRHLVLGPAFGWYALGGFACGLGVITKGTGFLPWLLLLPWALAKRRGMQGLATIPRSGRWLWGPLAFLAPILLWALPILWLAAQPGHEEIAAYRDDLLWRQTVVRYGNAWHHHAPFWYYLVEVVPVLWMPLTLLLPWAVPAWWRRIRRGQALPLLLLGWVVLVLLFFSLSPGKRGVYILPALPALALALAPLLPGLLRRPDVHAWLRWLALGLSLLLLAGSLWALSGRAGFAQRLLEQSGVAPWGWLAGVGALGLVGSLWLWRRGAFALALVLALLWSGYGLLGYPDMDAARSGRALIERATAPLPERAELGIVGGPEQFLLQARQHPRLAGARAFGYRTPLARQRADAVAWLREAPNRWLLIQHTDLGACLRAEGGFDAGWSNRRRWWVLDARALVPDCVPDPADEEDSPLRIDDDA